MPKSPLKPCRQSGCPALTADGYCERHQKEQRRHQEGQRLSASERGYDANWHKASRMFLAENPLCAECGRHGIDAAATVVDHIKPHKGDMVLFWDQSNWQSLCKPCHDSKTGREDGRWGVGKISGGLQN